MGSVTEPFAAPRHRCINAVCGCADLVSAGPCNEWCAAHTIELADIERGKVVLNESNATCQCAHDMCLQYLKASQERVAAL